MNAPKSELPFKGMENVRKMLVRDYDFSENDAAGVTMAVNDAVQMVLDRFDEFETGVNGRFDRLESSINRRFAEVKRNQWLHTIGVIVTVVAAAVVPALM